MPKCSVPDCESPSRVHGFCTKHYQRFQKYGTPDGGLRNHGSPEERFWRFVKKGQADTCWLWQGAVSTYGYGQFKVSEKPVRYKLAHRLSYEIHNGPVTSEDIIRHSCDTPLCVNPHHLAAGTHADNVADKVAKGRQGSAVHVGAKNPNAVLKEDDVRRIRAAPPHHSYAALAEKFGVTKGAIASIKKRRLWKHIP